MEQDIDQPPPGVRLAVELPRAMESEETVRRRLRLFRQKGFTDAFCGNLSAMRLALEEGFTVTADTGMNLLNSESLNATAALGAGAAVLSYEITFSEAAALNAPFPKGMVAYGHIPLMLFRNCPVKNGQNCGACRQKGRMTDRLGAEFSVRCRSGYSELFNSVPIWLADKQQDLKTVDFAVLFFTEESADRAQEVLTAYQTGAAPAGQYTRGLYYRGSL